MHSSKLSDLSDKILDVALLIESSRDACMGIDNPAHTHLLNIALEQQQEIYDEIETMY